MYIYFDPYGKLVVNVVLFSAGEGTVTLEFEPWV